MGHISTILVTVNDTHRRFSLYLKGRASGRVNVGLCNRQLVLECFYRWCIGSLYVKTIMRFVCMSFCHPIWLAVFFLVLFCIVFFVSETSYVCESVSKNVHIGHLGQVNYLWFYYTSDKTLAVVASRVMPDIHSLDSSTVSVHHLCHSVSFI